MKKVQDYSVGLKIRVIGYDRVVSVECSIHTTIHMLGIEVCKHLKLPPLDTSLEFFQKQFQKMKATTTLLQNGIVSNSTLQAKVRSHKDIGSEQKEGQFSQSGLFVKAVCKNKNCVSFSEEIYVNVGFGKFEVDEMLQSLKCELCPYKSQNIRSSYSVKDFYIKGAWYRLTSVIHVCESIFKEKKGNWVKVNSEKCLTKEIRNQVENSIGKVLEIKQL